VTSKSRVAGMRNGEGRFGQVIWFTPTEQNASAAFLLARDQSISENCSMIPVATALGLKIESCSVVVEDLNPMRYGCSAAKPRRA
jgi:hypothetical protein